jgi:hypothetical protein
LINRRHYLPRLLLTLSSIEKKRPAHLDRSLHINFRIAGDPSGTSFPPLPTYSSPSGVSPGV